MCFCIRESLVVTWPSYGLLRVRTCVLPYIPPLRLAKYQLFKRNPFRVGQVIRRQLSDRGIVHMAHGHSFGGLCRPGEQPTSSTPPYDLSGMQSGEVDKAHPN